MEIWNEPVSFKIGAAYLEAGFTIRTLESKEIGGDYIGTMRAVNPPTDNAFGKSNNAPWGGVLTTRGLVFWRMPEGSLKAVDAKTDRKSGHFTPASSSLR